MNELSTAIETLGSLLREVLAEPPATLDPDSDMIDELGLSSVDVMELISLVEDTWDIAFPLNDLASIRTMHQLAERILALGAGS
jgi:acyl carrier protein